MKKVVVLLVLLILAASYAQEMRDYTDALDRTVSIPVKPQRIISHDDWSITTPLIEMGAPVVGSHGRVRDDGSTYIRSAEAILRVGFDNSDITFVGSFDAMDYEAMLLLEPDLIIARMHPSQIEQLDRLETIAPVVFINDNKKLIDVYRDIADVAGMLEQFEARAVYYDKLMEEARAWLGEHNYTYSIIQGSEGGTFNIYARYGVLTDILEDLGFQLVGEGAVLREQGKFRASYSGELIPEQNADFVFDTYIIDIGAEGGPASVDYLLEKALPGYCKFLQACAEGRFIMVSREHVFAATFQSFEMMVHLLVSHIAGRPSISLSD